MVRFTKEFPAQSRVRRTPPLLHQRRWVTRVLEPESVFFFFEEAFVRNPSIEETESMLFYPPPALFFSPRFLSPSLALTLFSPFLLFFSHPPPNPPIQVQE